MAATRQTLTWVKNSRGTPANYVTKEEGSTQSFKKGAVLDLSSTAQLLEADRSSGALVEDAIYGLAAEDATGTQGTELDVLIPSADDEFICALASDADTVIAPGAGATSQIGAVGGIVKLSTTGGAGTEYVFLAGGTTGDCKIIDFWKPDVEKRGGVSSLVAGDRVVIRFLDATLGADSQD